jgi:hypothetical protein
MQEYERLRVEIEDMRREAAERGSRWPRGLRETV